MVTFRAGIFSITLLTAFVLNSPAQNAELFANLNQTPRSRGSFPSGLTASGSMLYFVADDGIHGRELWETLGTAETTRMVFDLTPGPASSWIEPIMAAGPEFYFKVIRNDVQELWKLDQQQRMQKVYGFPAGSEIFSSPAASWRGMLFFEVQNSGLTSLWRTQGSAASTIRLTGNDVTPGREFAGTANWLLFRAEDPSRGEELWRTDGTEPGTVIVKDLCKGSCSSEPGMLTSFAGNVVFSADDGEHGQELWRSDGTEPQTRLIQDLIPGPVGTDVGYQFGVISNRYLIFWSGDELWRIDALFRVTLIKKLRFGILSFLSIGEQVFLVAFQKETGEELWITDGTAGGTRLVKDVTPGSDSTLIEFLGVAGKKIFFKTYSFTLNDVFVSDGTADGTFGLGGINTDSITSAGTLAYFSSVDLMRTDGTQAGTFAINNIRRNDGDSSPRSLFTLGTELYFTASAGSKTGLWKTNGTSQPVMILEGSVDFFARVNPSLVVFSKTEGWHRALFSLRAGGQPVRIIGSDWIGRLTSAAGRVFFVVTRNNQAGLWMTNGTVAGTRAVPGANVNVSGVSNGFLYSAECTPYKSCRLWRTNGARTEVFRTISGPQVVLVRHVFGGGPNAYYVIQMKDHYEMWTTRGTGATTHKLCDLPSSVYEWKLIYPAFFFTNYSNLMKLWSVDLNNGTSTLISDSGDQVYQDVRLIGRVQNSLLYYHLGKVWRSDGTVKGTSALADVRYAVEGNRIGTVVYFSGQTLSTGFEPWVSDGTPAGTRMLRDIYGGPYDSSPAGFTLFGGYVYFSAESQREGKELWRAPVQ